MAIHYPLRLGPRGSSNGRVHRAVRSGRVPYTLQVKHLYECRIRFGAGDFTPAAATSQVIDLNSIRFFPPFPQQVRATDPVIRRLPGTYAFVKTGIAGTGITDADIEVGDSVDPNGLLTVSPAYDGDEGLVAATRNAAESCGRGDRAGRLEAGWPTGLPSGAVPISFRARSCSTSMCSTATSSA